MKKIVGVRFKRLGKIYFFDPKWLEVQKGEYIIVETTQGEDIAEVIIPGRMIDEEKLNTPLKKVLRLASSKDLKHAEDLKKKEKEAFEYCNKKIKEYKLDMTLTDVEYKFDNSKILFSFTSDGRVDFRELVKDLAATYKTRIELRQIGVRDEVKRIGGNGVCGRELCCCSFLGDFETVSIKMAKEQNLSLNPTKISGNCGRLMCCLKYEQEVYEEKEKRLPHVGAIVKTPDGVGEVDNVETLKEAVRVRIKDGDIFKQKRYEVKDIKVIKDVKIEEDLGLFEPFKGDLEKIQCGFKKAVDEEVKSQRMKTDLISNVSHDLKTPLTAIITYADLLKDENLSDEKRKQYIETLDRKAQRLQVLIENLFEVSKATSGNITLNIENIDVVSLMKQTLFELEDKLEKASLLVRKNMPKEKVILPLDSQRTFRVFENLIINITKYAMPNTRVFIDIIENEDDVAIIMKNMAAEEITFNVDTIAERFVRGDESRNTEGSGLGLAIAKSFVELQGGTFNISVDGDLFKVKIVFVK